MGEKRLCRSESNKMVMGVCGGIGEYLGIDPTLIRLGWIFFSLLGGSGLLAYILATLVMPEQGY